MAKYIAELEVFRSKVGGGALPLLQMKSGGANSPHSLFRSTLATASIVTPTH